MAKPLVPVLVILFLFLATSAQSDSKIPTGIWRCGPHAVCVNVMRIHRDGDTVTADVLVFGRGATKRGQIRRDCTTGQTEGVGIEWLPEKYKLKADVGWICNNSPASE